LNSAVNLVNILNNSVKYTKKGCITMFVTCKMKEDIAILSFAVKDTGIGIKECDLPKLREKFVMIEAIAKPISYETLENINSLSGGRC